MVSNRVRRAHANVLRRRLDTAEFDSHGIVAQSNKHSDRANHQKHEGKPFHGTGRSAKIFSMICSLVTSSASAS